MDDLRGNRQRVDTDAAKEFPVRHLVGQHLSSRWLHGGPGELPLSLNRRGSIEYCSSGLDGAEPPKREAAHRARATIRRILQGSPRSHFTVSSGQDEQQTRAPDAGQESRAGRATTSSLPRGLAWEPSTHPPSAVHCKDTGHARRHGVTACERTRAVAFASRQVK